MAPTSIPVLGYDDVLALVSPAEAVERTRQAFLRYAAGDWVMPPKVYLDCPPHGDFRAMPARGDGVAILKWVSSFPGAPAQGVPTVSGLLVVSDATTGATRLLLDARSVTALRTGAVAAVAATALARPGGTAAVVGCGVHGRWAARCLQAVGYSDGRCYDPDRRRAEDLAVELGWQAVTDLRDALAADVVSCVTPGSTPVVTVDDVRPGMHLNMLGADGPGKAEATVEAVAACRLFCDDWTQASHGGELTGAVEAGLVGRHDVTELGAVLAGTAPGRPDAGAVTLFDSTGLAIQDLGIALAVLERVRAGGVDVPAVEL